MEEEVKAQDSWVPLTSFLLLEAALGEELTIFLILGRFSIRICFFQEVI
jgi:hypothetical protein